MKAVISTAGYGTRFFPVSKVINKCMLPILNRPILAFLVDDLIAAGVEEICFVVRPDDSQVRAYWTENTGMKYFFEQRGWGDKYQAVDEIHRAADFSFITQPTDMGYGTAIPALLARHFIGGDDFLLLTGDDVVLGGSDIAGLISDRDTRGALGAVSAVEVAPDVVNRYGILDVQGDRLVGAVEKPDIAVAPSRLASISRFLLPSSSLEYFTRLEPSSSTGELQSIDALMQFSRDSYVTVHRTGGQYFDCGQVDGWLAANNFAAKRS